MLARLFLLPVGAQRLVGGTSGPDQGGLRKSSA